MMNNNKKGFTLLEVIVAIMIFAIAVTSMLTSMGQGATLTYETKDYLKAVHLSEVKINEVERDIAKNGISEDNVENKGQFEDEAFEKFFWIERRKKIEIPDDLGMISSLFGGGGSSADEIGNDMSGTVNKEASTQSNMFGSFQPFIQTIMDLFESSIREIEVEVYWYNDDDYNKENKNSFILTTHYIDLKKLDAVPNIGNLLNQLGGSSSKSSSSDKSESK